MITTIPQLAPLVKEAAQDWESFPCDTKEQAFFSAIYAGYLEKTASLDSPPHVQRATKLYKIAQESIDQIVQKLVSVHLPKEIEDTSEQMKVAEVVLLTKSAGEIQAFAQEFNHTFETPELQVKAGQVCFEKQACLEMIEARQHYKPSHALTTLQQQLEKVASDSLSLEDSAQFAIAMEAIDKTAGYELKGFNFVKDAARKSALQVSCDSRKIPVESFIRLGKDRLTQIIGEPVSSTDPQELKAIVESLPRDIQKLLLRYVK